MLIPSVVSLILFNQHVAGHPERHFRGLWAANWEQRRDDSLDVLMAAARAVAGGVVSSLVSRRRFSFRYPSVEPSIGNPVSGPCFCACGCGIKGPVPGCFSCTLRFPLVIFDDLLVIVLSISFAVTVCTKCCWLIPLCPPSVALKTGWVQPTDKATGMC